MLNLTFNVDCLKSFKFLFFGVILYSTIVGCAKTPIQQFIKSNKYEPFEIPRSDWGAGTIITFKSGREEIIALCPTCINLIPDSTDVVLSSYSYTLNKDNKLELSFAKALNGNLDIGAAFSSSRVKKVNIEVVKPKEKILQILLVNRRIKDLGTQGVQDCVNDIFDANNVVITRTLSVESLSYTFIDSSNKKISLSADFLDKINASDSLKRVYDSKTELTISKPTYIGYWASKFSAQPGLTQTEIKSNALTSKTINKMKVNSSNH